MTAVSDEDAKAYARIVGALQAADALAAVCETMIEKKIVTPDGQVAKKLAELRKYRPKE